MIDDGPAYKLLLQRAVKRFEIDLQKWPWPPTRAAGDDWSTYWQARFEDTLFRVGLGVRKLIEASKLSVEVQERPISAIFMPVRGGVFPGVIDQHRIEKFYDGEAAQRVQLPVLLLCHAIVHSHVLVPQFTGSSHSGLRLENFYLASDRGRKGGVYLIDWRTFVDELVNVVTLDDVVEMLAFRLPNGEELRIPFSTHQGFTDSRDRAISVYRSLSQGNAKFVDKFMHEWQKAYGQAPGPEASA
ncbi:hypothetical protein OG279_25325 [Streptomyces sp. NBC_01201]|uniref:hypothetical protein n=1 Tax=Streptomyces sp. NBC_01201 TaxID=2903770 RepID=UPI002E151286|nr:hypothetical protein OG279_25325 [Streptomyces sp. NBC_01201]